MSNGVSGVFIDHQQIVICSYRNQQFLTESFDCNHNAIVDKDLYELCECACFPASFDDIEKMIINHKLKTSCYDANQEINFHVAYVIGMIYDIYRKTSVELIDVDITKELLVIHMDQKCLSIGMVEVTNSEGVIKYRQEAIGLFEEVSIKEISLVLLKYVLDLLIDVHGGGEFNQLYEEYEYYYYSKRFRDSACARTVESIERLMKAVQSGVNLLIKGENVELDFTESGLGKTKITQKTFEDYILSTFKASIKNAIETFYVQNKEVLKGKNVDEIVVAGQISDSECLCGFVSGLFDIGINEMHKISDSAEILARSCAIHAALKKGELVEPFSQKTYASLKHNIVIRQYGVKNTQSILVNKGAKLPCRIVENQKLKVESAYLSPLTFIIEKDLGQTEELIRLVIPTPFFYHNDSLGFDIAIDESGNVEGIIEHMRTKIKSEFGFSI